MEDHFISDNEKRLMAADEVRYTFGKAERLRHRTLVNRLYEQGGSIYAYPLRVVWHVLSPEELRASFRDHLPSGIGRLQMMVTIPKRKQKRAVDRVLLRRRVREAYRLSRLPLRRLVEDDRSVGLLELGFIYLSDEIADYSKIEAQMRRLLDKVAAKIWSKES